MVVESIFQLFELATNVLEGNGDWQFYCWASIDCCFFHLMMMMMMMTMMAVQSNEGMPFYFFHLTNFEKSESVSTMAIATN